MNKINYNPDVLSCIANLSSDEVFTPPSLVNKMLDLLPNDLWSNKNAKFLDPATKSGVFLREIAKRLLIGLEGQIPNTQERVNHIFQNQIHGIATTELTSLLARRSLYCSKLANGKYSVCEFDDEKGNIIYDNISHSFKNGKCIFCGANQEAYDRGDEYESHAYQFIHESFEKFKDMKFDVIIGNPPYQLSDGGHGRSAGPIYNLFVEQAKKLNPQNLVMIVPDRWFAGGKGLDSFRSSMLADSKIKEIYDYSSASECFPGADVPGGICIFHWAKNYDGLCKFTSNNSGKEKTSFRKLDQFDTLIRDVDAAVILDKMKKIGFKSMALKVSSRKPFGLATNVKHENVGELKLLTYLGFGNFPKEKVTAGLHLIDKWKVVTSKVSYDHAGQPDKEGKRRVFSKILVLPPQAICSETYIVVDSFDNEIKAKALENYLKTKFVRFLVAQLSFSQDITKDRFGFVPDLPMSEDWTDEKLYKKYGLNDEEVIYIDSIIKAME